MKKKSQPPKNAGGLATHPIPPEWQAAWLMHQRHELNADFARRCLKVALISTTAFICTLPVIAGLGWKVAHPPVKYFATKAGYIVPIHPTSAPAYSDGDVVAWGEKTLRKAFTLDYKNYRSQISAMQSDFSGDGFSSYYAALTRQSNLYSAVKDKRMLMTPDVTHPGTIVKRGQPGGSGPYMWEVQYPVTLSLDGQNNRLQPQKFIFSVRIQQTNVLLKPGGLEVAAIDTHTAS
ncbi:DotI/IcmL/TraM family protein [Klebsiella aerogenes]